VARTARTIDLPVDLPDSPAPLRHRIGDALVAQIRSGALRPGDPLPTTRALAAHLRVARSAVVQAYDELLAAGFTTAQQGSGTFVAPGADRAAQAGAVAHVREAPAGPAPAHRRDRPPTAPARWSLEPSSPDTDLLDATDWRRAWRRAAAEPVGARFPGPQAARPLREALAQHLRRTRGVVADPDEVLLVPGVAAALRPLFLGLGLAGRTVAVEDPGYRDPADALADVGARARPVPVDDDGLQPSLLRDDDAAVYLTPAHQFPLGARLCVDRRCDVLDWASRTGGLVLEDDYDGEFRYDVSPLPALRSMPGAADHVVYLGTSSKVLTPELRIAWVVAPAHLRDELRRRVAQHGLAVDGVGARALAELVASGGLARHLARASRHYAARRASVQEALSRHLPELDVVGIDAGLHVVVRLDDDVDDLAVADRAAALGVAVEPLSAYAAADHRRGLVVGYARLPGGRADEVVRALARAVHP
jgi:GntR family transcriptional regulator/MocR family aminotransferase